MKYVLWDYEKDGVTPRKREFTNWQNFHYYVAICRRFQYKYRIEIRKDEAFE